MDCPVDRGIGWFIEGIIPLLLFCKNQIVLKFIGITNGGGDLSVDMIKNVTLPLLAHFGVNAEVDIQSRGFPPLGGGEVLLKVDPISSGVLNNVSMGNEYKVTKIAGLAVCSLLSPQLNNRVISSCKPLLRPLCRDVHIFSDVDKRGRGGGVGVKRKSPGYSLLLVALSSPSSKFRSQEEQDEEKEEDKEEERRSGGLEGNDHMRVAVEITSNPSSSSSLSLPEEVGLACGGSLLEEIMKGGAVDSHHQPLALLLMALSKDKVSTINVGERLCGGGVEVLRLVKKVFGVQFQIKKTDQGIKLSCLGANIVSRSRAVS